MSKKFNRTPAGNRHTAFSLIELVIVVVIIGIIAAIAIPKMSRGSAGAGDSALSGNLAVLRNAIELYNAEHAAFPGSTIVDQLTKYTDASGATSATKTGDFTYGPYLKAIPKMPVGTKKGQSDVKVSATSVATATADTEAWLYISGTGEVYANYTGGASGVKGTDGKTNYSDY